MPYKNPEDKRKNRLEYNARPEVIAYILEYRARPEVIARALNYSREYESLPEVREMRKEWKRERRLDPEFRASEAQYARERRNSSPQAKLEDNLRRGQRKVLNGGAKTGKYVDVLGCSHEELRAHIESLFAPGMSWSNRGRPGWEIDHKRPLCSFDLQNPEEWAIAGHHKNLQPLWSADNRAKGKKYDIPV